MTISINQATRVINFPKADLTLIEGTLFEMDVNQLRLDLKDLEDDSIGMALVDSHRHATEVILSGVTYARFFELINGFTIEIEDGQYTVQFVGANHNLADARVQNQVSYVIGNSAGLIVVSGVGTDVNIVQIRGSATAARMLEEGTRGNVFGTIGSGSSSTSLVTSSVTPTPSASIPNQNVGRQLTFREDTITVALRGQATDITAATAATIPVYTVTQLTAAPVSGDNFVIT